MRTLTCPFPHKVGELGVKATSCQWCCVVYFVFGFMLLSRQVYDDDDDDECICLMMMMMMMTVFV